MDSGSAKFRTKIVENRLNFEYTELPRVFADLGWKHYSLKTRGELACTEHAPVEPWAEFLQRWPEFFAFARHWGRAE